MTVSPHIFRAYDIRGVYPTELNEGAAYEIARVYGELFPRSKTIVVSRDFRVSSPALADALIQGLLDEGRTIVDIGAGPVPVFYFAIVRGKYDGGLMVTGSHNPVQYNGIKIQREGAIPITGETGIYAMRDRILTSKRKVQSSKAKGVIQKRRFIEEYIQYVAAKTKLGRPLKIVLDTGNGACGDIPERIFQKLGCEVKTLFKKPDGTFPHHIPDPHQEETLKFLQKEVVKEGADCGIAFDGDGDRAGLVDEKGKVVGMDFVLMMLARQALTRAKEQEKGGTKKQKVVVDVRASRAFLEDIKTHGGEPLMTRVGHSYLLHKIIEEKAVFGGEFSGHFYFPREYFDYDDGIFAACKLAEIVSDVASISAYVDSLPRYTASPEIFIESTDDEKFKKVEEIVEYTRKQGYATVDLDGVRIEFPNGWALIRASNTTPDIKLRFEGETKNDLKEIAKVLASILKAIRLKAPEDLRSF